MNIDGNTELFWMQRSLPAQSEYDSAQYKEFAERTLNKIISQGENAVPDLHGQLFEAALEWVRLRDFPLKPSRLHSIFLWTNYPQAFHFAKDAPHAQILRVRPKEIRKIHLGDFNLIHWLDTQMSLQSFLDRAMKYWEGSTDERRERIDELVFDGRVQIIVFQETTQVDGLLEPSLPT